MPPGPFKNTILQHLDPEIVGRLKLREVKLEAGREVEYPGASIDHLFFIESGVGSMTVTFNDGSQVQSSMFGYESVMGVPALMGTKRSLNRVYMQLDGYGFMSPIDVARSEFERCGEFHHLTLRYVQAQLTQSTQTAACNAKHSIDQRLARWLLLCADRAHTNSFIMSQEFLSDMLGVTRSSVNVAATQLRDLGLIEYSRSHIHIPDPGALEQRSCECYGVVKEHLDNYVEFDTNFTA